ncbi:flagellin [Roseomonas sp. GC11]|uniref:flagellin n=1 Tax=Roseomonas sp. GC11 TaxID=2950546 RepID=UPI00210F1BC8|nr:flagellin [Roseomonas sp. GC11]MCQ4162283.1 flagellin [Roseomonas sp. GC11]
MTIRGSYAASLASISKLQERYNELTRQQASGTRATTYAGLGGDATRAITLGNKLAASQQAASTTTRAAARVDYSLTVMDRLSSIASDMADSAASLNGTTDSLDSVRSNAQAALKEVLGLLGETYDGEYIFGGSDLSNSPVVAADDIESTGLYTQIGDLLGTLDADNAEDVFSSILSVASSNEDGVSPFSSYANAAAEGEVEDSRRSVSTGTGGSVEVGLYANRNAGVGETGTGTGSWARDLIAGLTVLANLTDEQASQDGYSTIVEKTVSLLRGANSGANDEIAVLGTTQNKLTDAASWQEEVATQLEEQLGDVTSVDLATASVQLSQVNLQLQASYQALAKLGEVSLVNYL